MLSHDAFGFFRLRIAGVVAELKRAAQKNRIGAGEHIQITVAAADTAKIERALEWIRSLTEEPEIGRIYEGKVGSIKDFGAFVNILPGTDGMVHISQLSDTRVEKVEDVLSMGQIVKVKLTGIDEKGRLSLSVKEATR